MADRTGDARYLAEATEVHFQYVKCRQVFDPDAREMRIYKDELQTEEATHQSSMPALH